MGNPSWAGEGMIVVPDKACRIKHGFLLLGHLENTSIGSVILTTHDYYYIIMIGIECRITDAHLFNTWPGDALFVKSKVCIKWLETCDAIESHPLHVEFTNYVHANNPNR